LTRASVTAGAPVKSSVSRAAARPATSAVFAPAVNFADVVERINPAVVNIDATARGQEGRRRRGRTSIPDPPDSPFEFGPRNERDNPHRGAGTGFVIDADGSILTNNHVV